MSNQLHGIPGFALAFLAPLFLAGCDAYLRVQQDAQILVLDLAIDCALPGAVVGFAHADRPMKGLSGTQLSKDEWLNKYDYRCQVTDARGRAVLPVDIGWISGAIFQDCNTRRDRLTGEVYLFRVTHGQWTDVFDVEMVPGSTSAGSHCRVTIETISRPSRLPAFRHERRR